MTSVSCWRRTALAGAILLGVSVAGKGARAADFVVSNTNDSGAGSLRQAVLNANTSPDDDSISFDTSSFSGAQVITLTSGELSFASGRLVVIGPDASAGSVTISGNTASRIGTVAGGADVVLSHLTLANGVGNSIGSSNSYGLKTSGGALFNAGILTVSRCTFANNASGSGGNGGAIQNYGGTLIVADSRFTNNSALILSGDGGTTGGRGGAIENGSGEVSPPASRLRVTNSTFTGNGAINGGAISAQRNGEVTIGNSTFAGNTTTDESASSGGALISFGSLTVDASTFSGNSSVSGGALSAQGPGQAVVRSSTFASNRASSASRRTVLGGAILNNSTGSQGGGLTVESSTLTGNQSGFGGGIFTVQSSPLTLNSSIVANNSASTAADIYGSVMGGDYNLVKDATYATLSGSHNITGKDPQLGLLADNGGPTQTFLPQAGSPAIDAGNSTLSSDQRGIIRPIDNLTVTNADGGNGSDIGAVEVEAAQNATEPVVNKTDDHDDGICSVNDCTLREAINAVNSSNEGGTVRFDPTVFARKTTLELNSTLPTITKFVALFGVTSNGAGVTLHNSASADTLVVSGGNLSLTNLTVLGAQGRGLAILSGQALVQGCTFASNAIGIQNNGTLQMNNSTLTGSSDTALNNGGTTVMDSCTVTANARGVDIENGKVELLNSLVVGNGTNLAGNIAFTDRGSNITTGSTTEAGLDPNGLKDNGGPTPTVALVVGGSAVNGGATLLETDQRGGARPQRGNPDVGAFELVNAPPIVDSVTLSPDAPRTDDPLTARVAASDTDNDTLTYSFTWTRRRGESTTVIRTTQSTSSPSDTLDTKGSIVMAGDVITVSVAANDGVGYSESREASVVIFNSPVSVTRVTLRPISPRSADTIVANVAASDDDKVRPTFTYVWKKTYNGRTVTILTTQSTGSQASYDLSKPTYGNKGDVITLTVTASDGQTSDSKTASVTVGNTAPVMTSLAFQSQTPTSTSIVRVNAKASDIDATEHVDTLTYSYKWRIGTRLLTGETTSTLDLKKYPFVKNGDAVSVEVRAGDGSSLSAGLTGRVIVGGTANSPSAGNS